MAGRVHDPDWDLVRKSKRGDTEAFAELVRRHQQSVFNFCLRMLRNVEDAEDIAQEVFVQAYRNVKRFRPRAKFSTWLFAIAKNMSLNLIRDQKRGSRLMLPIDDGLDGVTVAADATGRPDSKAAVHETADVVRAAIDRLSEDHKLVIVLRDLEGLSYREVGRVLQCPPGTVKSRLARARANLKEILWAELDRGDLL